MHQSSHKLLGKYLTKQYLRNCPRRYVAAFLLGCIQPDKNPATYIKGSIRFQILRGHNYLNAQHYIELLTARLSRKQSFHLTDFYSLGKLVHYAADAFTYPHNDFFIQSLKDHRRYEQTLHSYLAEYLSNVASYPHTATTELSKMIQKWHKEYTRASRDPHTDCTFILHVCSSILLSLLQDKYSSLTDGPNVLGVAVESN